MEQLTEEQIKRLYDLVNEALDVVRGFCQLQNEIPGLESMTDGANITYGARLNVLSVAVDMLDGFVMDAMEYDGDKE